MDASDVNDILTFMSVVETGSFVAGGRARGLSRSAAGKAVARLETRLSVRLLDRTTRALRLTDDGRTLLRHAETLRAAMDAAERSVAREDGDPRGTLRLTVPDAFGRRHILPSVRRFLDAWPDVQVEMSVSDRVSSLVEDGFDLAIRIGATDPGAGLIMRTLMQDELILCAAPSYLARIPAPSTPESLGRHDLLFHATHNARLHWRLQAPDGTWTRAQGRSRLRLDSGEALREATLAGMGIALLPAFLVGDDISAGHLTRVLPAVSAGTVQIVALYPHRRLLDPKVRRFIDHLAAELAR